MLIVSTLNGRVFNESLKKRFEALIALDFTHFDSAFFDVGIIQMAE